MPNRIIKDSIRTSKSINAMSDFQFRLWAYLITYVDDYGRGSADPELLKGFVFPRRKGVTEVTIQKTLAELATAGSVILYEVDGEPYLCFPNWSEHQAIRNKVSKYPAPEDGEITIASNCNQLKSNAINCKQMKSIASKCSRNPIQSNPNPESNPNTESGNARSAFRPPTLEEVQAYCKERNSPVDPKQFYDYFSEGNWHDANNRPVRSWKQKLLTWEKYDSVPTRKKAMAPMPKQESREASAGSLKKDMDWLDEFLAEQAAKEGGA